MSKRKARRPGAAAVGEPPFKKVLIANRGEIAVRIIRGLHELGIRSVAVYSEADRTALHVRFAHEAYLLGPAAPAESYLNIRRIIEVAKEADVDAIHPGYGFLSENADFARACRDAGIVFVGPPPEAMEALGDKIRARELMTEAGVPVVPGTPPLSEDLDEVRTLANEIGYPILLKAAAGGGGKGMRIVNSEDELPSLLAQARGEAGSSFGNDTVFMEKFVERPRHIEFQILADTHGNFIHLGERECSIQRRHQKLIEESPAIVMDEATRKEVGELAIRACRAAGYHSAGTVEFLRGEDGSFYFMEVNARLQVEHPVTEMVTGQDLVKLMIAVAAGEKLPLQQDDIRMAGHAIECRIIAEDARRNFIPSPGTIRGLRAPGGPGVRFDDGTYAGYTVPVHYDPMIGKLIVWGQDRTEAISRMVRALDELRIDGLTTSISFHKQVMQDAAFIDGDLHTGFLEQHPHLLESAVNPWLDEVAIVAAAIVHLRQVESTSAQATAANTDGVSAWRWPQAKGWRR
ncbi:MAG: acetyl-CoA carboxylase biotin carboxylase subunit [Acidobacteriota bacterium]|nr:acetyl-CoA carboxylase biotin carboxylase subunit [Acidobacteriota bacterium]